jgi:hypothetical protein
MARSIGADIKELKRIFVRQQISGQAIDMGRGELIKGNCAMRWIGQTPSGFSSDVQTVLR